MCFEYAKYVHNLDVHYMKIAQEGYTFLDVEIAFFIKFTFTCVTLFCKKEQIL